MAEEASETVERDSPLMGLFNKFYTTSRAGAFRLSDGGGPLGFDITVALQIDHLVRAYRCDGLVETGCHFGDTTEFLARQYSELPVVTCDIDENCSLFTRARCAGLENVLVLTGDSAEILPEMTSGMKRPLILLDAHWYEPWPLPAELALAASFVTAVLCIDDFYINHPRFGFDEYGRRCDAELVAQYMPDQSRMFIGNPYADYAFPCLQVGRRAGTGYVAIGADDGALHGSEMFCRIDLRTPEILPNWECVSVALEAPGGAQSH